MPSPVAAPAPVTPTEQRAGTYSGKNILGLIVLVILVVLVGAAAFLWHRYWPFEQKPVVADLAESADSQVTVRGFHRTYFPPGCVLDGVVFTRGANSPHPLITIDKLTIQGSYVSMLSSRVNRITAEGLHVFIPAFGTAPPFHAQRSTTAIGEIIANGMTVEFANPKPEGLPYHFDIHEADLHDVGENGPLTYRLKVHNPEPPGEVTASGKFGMWNDDDPGQTPISGEYKFEQANLSVYHGIAGMLSSVGKFSGKLEHIDISGTTDVPDFMVVSGHHPVHLKAEFSAYVDARHGDTFLNRVDAHFRKTHVVVHGSIAKSAKGKGKAGLIDLSTDNGRIEDVLGLFVEAPRAPMSGPVTLRAHVEIPTSSQPFLEKISLKGKFGIAGGDFTNPDTQEGVNKLSAGARGAKDTSDPETVLTDLTGEVALDKGVSTFSDISFGIPGAAALMHGTYNLINYKIDLRGQMKVKTKISQTTTGPKSLLLKMMDPFFKKRKKGEVVPVRISGTYEKPSFGLDFNDKQAQTIDPPSHHHVRAGLHQPK